VDKEPKLDLISETAPEELSPMDVAVMQAEYGILVNKLLNACHGANPRVAMAALLGATGSIAVQSSANEMIARNYMFACVNDVVAQLAPAFKQKIQARIAAESANGKLDS